jgi:sugar-specific transcriptional regulator TrmB
MKNLPKKYHTLLHELGLTQNQSKLYLSILSQGVAGVTDIARVTGMSRQQIYTDAEKLVKLGLLDRTRKERRKYIAAHPTTLERIATQQIQKAQDLLTEVNAGIPALEKLIPHNQKDVAVKLYEGKSNVKMAYERELQATRNTEVLSLAGSIDDIFKFFPEKYWKKWNASFVERGNSSRMIAHSSPAARETQKHDAEYNRETRLLASFPLKVNIDVFDQTVLIVSFYDEIAIWLESPVVAESYRILFDLLWAQGK